MDKPRRTIHIDRKTESRWQKDETLCLVRSVVVTTRGND